MSLGLRKYVALHTKPARKPRAPKRDLEGPVQRAVIEAIRLTAPHVDVRHLTQGKSNSARVGASLKALGVKKGTADLLLFLKSGVGFIEVKTPHKRGWKDGGLEPEQVDFRDLCFASGTHWAVIYGADQIPDLMRLWGQVR